MVRNPIDEEGAWPHGRSSGRQYQIVAFHRKWPQALGAWRQSLIFNAMTGKETAEPGAGDPFRDFHRR
jgi:hypothetical protein